MDAKLRGEDWAVLIVATVLAILLPWWMLMLLTMSCGYRPTASCGIIP